MIKKYLPDFLALLVIAVLSIFSLRTLGIEGLAKLHDSSPHVARIIAYDTALKDGQVPPMWAKNLFGGIGSPVLMVSYQLPYIFTEIPVLLGLGFIDSYKLVLFLSLLLSGIAMYFALRQKFSVIPSLSGALLFCLAPYRMVDILVRGALGEAMSFVFFPLVLLGLYKKSFPWLVVGWTGLFLTHPLSSAIFSLFFFAYQIFVVDKKERKKEIVPFVASYLIALAISAFNILPVLGYTSLTHYSPEISNPLVHFPTFSQLMFSPWGIGASVAGPKDFMSFSLGFAHWAVVLGSIIFFFDAWQVGKKLLKEEKFFLVSFLVGLALILSISTPIYKLFRLHLFIDYPWRLLVFLVFCTSWLGANLISKFKRIGALLISVCILVLLLVQVVPITGKHPYYWDENTNVFEYDLGDDNGEYAPVYRESREVFVLEQNYLAPGLSVQEIENKSNQKKYEVDSTSGALFRLNTSYFPGWKANLDGKDISFEEGKVCGITKRVDLAHDDSGLMYCNLPKGKHELIFTFVTPPYQKAGNIVSVLGIVIFAGYLLKRKSIKKGL